jgi:hypothetical protein
MASGGSRVEGICRIGVQRAGLWAWAPAAAKRPMSMARPTAFPRMTRLPEAFGLLCLGALSRARVQGGLGWTALSRRAYAARLSGGTGSP